MDAPDPITRLNAALEDRYRIERELGEGGMATVYLARDLKHDREVALKVLKPELAAVVGADRFLAEIKTTANLQHPHILPLHDSGEADGLLYYVMPHVKGESLRQRLDREHQLPVDDAVRIATNMAEALDYAHSQGVIHRDIKPANVLLQSGKPVIADFGIALAVGAAGGGRLTETGLSVGTPHYMSPEQATGDQNVGPAADIYALGCVLYEMLVGAPPFSGSTPQAVLGKIISGETPSTRAERPSVPPNVDAAIARALEKIPADRFGSSGSFARALGDPGFQHGEAEARGRRAGGWKRAAIAATVAAGLSVALTLVFTWSEEESRVTHVPHPFLEGQGPTGWVRISRDGSTLVYAGPTDDRAESQLWVRRLDALESRPVPGTRSAGLLTFALSPEGDEVVFLPYLGPRTQPTIVSLDGGPERPVGVEALAVTHWSPDGHIYFAGGDASIRRVPVAGGAVDTLTDMSSAREELHLRFLPLNGGRQGLLEVRDVGNAWATTGAVWVLDAETGDRRLLVEGHSPRLTASGHLLFVTAEGILMAAPFDERRATLEGEAVPVLRSPLYQDPILGTAYYDVSDRGDLVYTVGAADLDRYEFVWIDRTGNATPLPGGPRFEPGVANNRGWKLSPDGTRLAYQGARAGVYDIYALDVRGGHVTQLTFDAAEDFSPRWSPDGTRISYFSTRGADSQQSGHLWTRPSDGSGEATPLFPDVNAMVGVWGRAGAWWVLRTSNLSSPHSEIIVTPPGSDTTGAYRIREATPVWNPAVSPDGQWLAYVTDGAVWVRPFPEVDDGRWRVSAESGQVPIWAHNGRELFFFDPEARTIVAAEYRSTPTFEVVRREVLFQVPSAIMTIGDFYDVDGKDQRFLMAQLNPPVDAGTQTHLYQGFFTELSRPGRR